jgi:hypothetical protein
MFKLFLSLPLRNNLPLGWVWWYMPIITANQEGFWKQEGFEFEASPGQVIKTKTTKKGLGEGVWL